MCKEKIHSFFYVFHSCIYMGIHVSTEILNVNPLIHEKKIFQRFVVLGEGGQDSADGLHTDVHLALLDGPDPALVIQVARQRVEGVG